MADFGYLKYNYGNNQHFQDSSLKRYTRYHNSGSTWIFNTGLSGSFNGCGCGCGNSCGGLGGFGWGGGAWSGILGFGAGLLGVGLLAGGIKWLCGGGLKGLFAGKEADKAGDKSGSTPTSGAEDSKINDLLEKVKNLTADVEALKATKADGDKVTTPKKEDTVPPAVEETAVDKMGKITDVTDFIAEFGKLTGLSDEDLDKILAQFQSLLADLDDASRLELAQNKDLDPRLLAIVRESYYIDGYSNVKKEDLTEDLEVVRAHDTGSPRDVEQAEGRAKSTIVIDGQEIEIEIHDKMGETNIDAKYEFVREEGGELIFKSKKAGSTQEYVLQKDSNGKLHLIQYEYHTGHNNADYTQS